MAIREIRVDRSKTLAEEPGTGHNRWHPDIAPVIHCEAGDEVGLETRDAFDGQMGPDASLETVASPNLDVVHALTGPVYVEGAEPGDVLEVEILHIEPDSYGYTVQVPGFGFLRDAFPEPFKVNWDIAEGWATSADLPGIRIPGSPFMGTIGLSPGHELLAATTAREQALLERGGFVLPPSPASAVPSDPRWQRKGCGRYRPASRPATSTSNSSARVPACSSRWTPPGRFSLLGTPTSPRAMVKPAAPRSRWAPPCTCVSACERARPPRRISAICGSPGRTTTCHPSTLRRAGSTPLPASRSPRTASTTPRTSPWPPATRSST